MKKRNLTLMTAGLLAALAAGSMSVQAADAIRVGDILSLGTASAFVAEDLGYFEEAGIDVEVTRFDDGPSLMEAFAAGELDIAMVGIAPATTWATKGVDLKIVAATNGGGHVILTRSDTGIETVEDLNGKLVAEPNIGSVTDAILRGKILADAGLTPDMDVILIPGMKPADMATTMMVSKETDAIITWEPYAAQAIAQYGDEISIVYDCASEIATEDGSIYPCNVVIATGDFIENHAEELDSFLEVHQKATDYINEDEGADEELGTLLQLEAEVIAEAKTRLEFTTSVNEEAVMEQLQYSVDLGYMTALPDKETLFDLAESGEAVTEQATE